MITVDRETDLMLGGKPKTAEETAWVEQYNAMMAW